jgi:hypothetical protein
MNKTLILIFILSKLLSFGQSSDSSVYFLFKDQENIESIIFHQDFYLNGNVKREGWFVKEKPVEKSKIHIALKTPPGSLLSVGVWKTYYRNGNVLSVDSFGINDTMITRFHFYKKNGFIDRIVIIKPLTLLYTSNDKFFGSVSNYEWMKKYIYYKNKLAVETFFTYKMKPSGIWKYYHNDNVIYTEEYDEKGKCINRKKYGT